MHTLRLNFAILQFCGMWRPLMWSTGWKFVVYNCYTTVMVSSLYLFALSQFLGLVLSSENVKEFSHGSYMFLTVLAACGKCASVVKQRKGIIDITNTLRNHFCEPRNEDETKIQNDCERDARFNTFWYSVLGGTTCSLITLRSLIVDISERNMPFKGWLPFDPKAGSEFGFWVAYFHQLIAHATTAILNSSFDTLVPGFMMQTCTQMKILKYRIESLPKVMEAKRTMLHEQNYEESVQERQSQESELLTECIRHHIQIFQLANSVNEIFSNVVFLQFSLSSLILCVSVYETSTMRLFSSEFTALMLYLCCMIVQIFIFCFYGGELTLQTYGLEIDHEFLQIFSSIIAGVIAPRPWFTESGCLKNVRGLRSVDMCDAVYQMDRSLLSTRTKKSLVMIMMRSLRPITFTCGNIITVSIDSFNKLIKLSYSVYNVLQRSGE